MIEWTDENRNLKKKYWYPDTKSTVCDSKFWFYVFNFFIGEILLSS